MGTRLFLECRRIIWKTIKLVWAQDISRLEKRYEFVRWRNSICNNNVLCKWIVRDCNRRRMIGGEMCVGTSGGENLGGDGSGGQELGGDVSGGEIFGGSGAREVELKQG